MRDALGAKAQQQAGEPPPQKFILYFLEVPAPK